MSGKFENDLITLQADDTAMVNPAAGEASMRLDTAGRLHTVANGTGEITTPSAAESGWLTDALAANPSAAAWLPLAGGAMTGDILFNAGQPHLLTSFGNIIVVDSAGNGDYDTVSAAMAAASYGDLIMLMNDVTEAIGITWVDGVSLAIVGGARYTFQTPGAGDAFQIPPGVTARIYGPGEIYADATTAYVFSAVACISDSGGAGARTIELYGINLISNGPLGAGVDITESATSLVMYGVTYNYDILGRGCVVSSDAVIVNCVINGLLQIDWSRDVQLFHSRVVASGFALVISQTAAQHADFIVSHCYLKSSSSNAIEVNSPVTLLRVVNCVFDGGVDAQISSYVASTSHGTNNKI